MAVHRREIYFVNLNPVKGREQAGDRPVLVLSVDAINKLPLVVVIFIAIGSVAYADDLKGRNRWGQHLLFFGFLENSKKNGCCPRFPPQAMFVKWLKEASK
ncbi:MAG: type II toxin-antitoxin system PemK/MazF family toxin [Candidatus Desantisbacteria bacterium]